MQRRQVSLPLWKIEAESAIGDDGDDDRQKEKHAARPGVGLVEGGPRRGAKKPKEGGGARAASSHPSKVMERLEEAVSRVMEGYNRARMEVIYGVDDVGRPLGDQHFGEHAGDDGQVQLSHPSSGYHSSESGRGNRRILGRGCGNHRGRTRSAATNGFF